MILSCPTKTFLLGEYLAMKGEPCLTASTGPRFVLSISRGPGASPFHPDSPAGRLWAKSSETTSGWSASFEAPVGVGGMGASSAEFLLLHTALQVRETLAWEAQLEPDLAELLREYAECSAGRGAPPSGADLVAQLKGQVTLFERERGRVESRGWGFSDLSFLLFSTGVKVPTHEHLATLKEWDSTALRLAVDVGVSAWLNRDSQGFLESVMATRGSLRALGFEAETTTSLLADITARPGVLAAKGCGALGADVIALFCRPSDKDSLRDAVSGKLRFLGSESDLAEGLQLVPQALREPEAMP